MHLSMRALAEAQWVFKIQTDQAAFSCESRLLVAPYARITSSWMSRVRISRDLRIRYNVLHLPSCTQTGRSALRSPANGRYDGAAEIEAMATRTPELELGGKKGEGTEGDGWDMLVHSPVGAESVPDGTRKNRHKQLKSVEQSAVCHQNRPQKYSPYARLRQAPARQRAARAPVLAEPEDEQTPLEIEVITLKMLNILKLDMPWR